MELFSARASRPYYFHAASKVTQWERPTGRAAGGARTTASGAAVPPDSSGGGAGSESGVPVVASGSASETRHGGHQRGMTRNRDHTHVEAYNVRFLQVTVLAKLSGVWKSGSCSGELFAMWELSNIMSPNTFARSALFC